MSIVFKYFYFLWDFFLGSKCIFDLTLTTLKSATKNFSPWPNLEIMIFMYRQFNKIKDAGVPEFSKKHPICAKKSHSLKSTKQTLKSHSTFTTKAMKTRWVSVVEFHDPTLGKVFGQESSVVKWNYQILSLHSVTVCQKVPILDFQSEFSMSKIIRICLIYFSMKNNWLGAHFL